MRAQLYLYSSLRKEFKRSIKLFSEIYFERVVPIFKDLEEESKAKADEKYKELGRKFDPDRNDISDFVEDAWEFGLDYYLERDLIRYNIRLMWISTLYQFWEQQVRKFIYEEVTKTHNFIDKKGNVIEFKNFMTKGIDDIKTELLEFGQDIEKFSCWEKINELRLLNNVIKHGDGWSATELKKIREDFFRDDFLGIDMLDLYKTTLNEKVLNLDDKEIEVYCEALIRFWDELPERMYSEESE